jgi:hypothetical protein
MLKKEQMRRWLTERLQTQKQLVMAAMAGMAVIGTVATLIEFVLFYLIIRYGLSQEWCSSHAGHADDSCDDSILHAALDAKTTGRHRA